MRLDPSIVGRTAKELIDQKWIDPDTGHSVKIIDAMPTESGWFLTLADITTGETFRIDTHHEEIEEIFEEKRDEKTALTFMDELEKL